MSAGRGGRRSTRRAGRRSADRRRGAGASDHGAGRIIALENSGGLAQSWPDGEPDPEEPQQPDQRIGGAQRIATSVELSQQFDSAETVVLATAEDYPDSLAGAPLASQLGAPSLLTFPDRVSASVTGEIERLADNTRLDEAAGEAADVTVERVAGRRPPACDAPACDARTRRVTRWRATAGVRVAQARPAAASSASLRTYWP